MHVSHLQFRCADAERHLKVILCLLGEGLDEETIETPVEGFEKGRPYMDGC
jgi:hypothetical protein